MTKEEKEKQLIRLRKRMLRFQSWMLDIKPTPNNEENRFDKLYLDNFTYLRPAFHCVKLAKEYRILKEIETE
jgi:hypothetical protein